VCKHEHVWKTVADPAVGVYAKRDCPGGEYECVGRAEGCACGAERFVPADPALKTVEIERRAA